MKDIRRRRAGFSLLEVAIASAVLMLFILLIYRLLFTTQDSTNRIAVNAYLHTQGQTVIDSILTEATSSKIVAVSTNNNQMAIQIPVDHDDDGDVIDGAGAIEYGFRDPTSGQAQTLDWGAIFTVDVQETLIESDIEIDVNRDGDTGDRFVVCQLLRRVVDETATTQDTLIITDDVLLNADDIDGDVDGDGDADPLFLLVDGTGTEVASAGTRLIVNIWFARKLDHPEYVLHNSRVEVSLRNEQ